MIAFSTTLISVPPNRFEANISFDLLCPNETPEHGCVSGRFSFPRGQYTYSVYQFGLSNSG